jgi:spermidine/putrescine transport system substrate-binding protein
MEKKPLDPMTQALVSAMSRRRLLQVGAIGGAAAFASACGVGGASENTVTPTQVEDLSDTEKFINWSTWIDYIDIDDAGNRPTLEKFKAETGITVNYDEDYNDNNEFYAKVKPQLEAGQSIDRDIVTPTDWMAGLWISKGYAQKIDKANVANSANMGATWEGVGFDPQREFSLPWQSGFGGLGWNKKLLKELTGKSELKTVDELWDPRLKGRITILSEMRDSMGVVLMALGKNANDFTDADFEAALAVLQEQVDSGQIRQVTGNDYKAAMAAGEVAAAIAWSGDMLNDTDTYGFNIPESGGTLWTDNMIIPIGAKHKKNAERWMDFYYDPVNAATVAAYVNYICPVEGAQAAMESIDPMMVNNPAIFPDADTLSRVQTFMQLSDAQQASFESSFQALAGA